MIHAAITIAVQLLLMLAGAPPLWAGAVPAAFYAGRELAQAEHRIIWANFGNSRALAPWWVGFMPAAWNRKALADLLLPIAAAIVTAALASIA